MLSSRYSCSSSVDDEATTVLNNLGDCPLYPACVTSYNQYFGGWATVVGGDIVVGDLTALTQEKFSGTFLPQESTATYASAFWVKEDGLETPDGVLYVLPWNSASVPPVFDWTNNLSGFTIENFSYIKAQISGTYFVTYSVTSLGSGRPQGWTLLNGNSSKTFADCYNDGTNTNIQNASGSCIFHVAQGDAVTLNTQGTFKVFTASITIRLIVADPPLPA